MARHTWNLPTIPAPESVQTSAGLKVPPGYEVAPMPPDPPVGARHAWCNASAGRLVIVGEPGDGDENTHEYEAHNCDFMGCGWDHVLEVREGAPAPATDS